MTTEWVVTITAGPGDPRPAFDGEAALEAVCERWPDVEMIGSADDGEQTVRADVVVDADTPTEAIEVACRMFADGKERRV